MSLKYTRSRRKREAKCGTPIIEREQLSEGFGCNLCTAIILGVSVCSACLIDLDPTPLQCVILWAC